MDTIFRPYSSSEGLRSDRSAGDRLRHRQKVRELVRDNIADLIAEESIIGKSKDKVIKVPIRGIKEYRFIYGSNAPGVGQGNGEAQPGDVIGKTPGRGQGAGGAGDRPGVDYYETDITLEELIDIMFEDLELPDLERRALRQTFIEKGSKRKGYRRVGIRVHLDKKRTAKSRLRRKFAATRHHPEGRLASKEEQRFPYHKDDLRYHRHNPDVQSESNAVVMCIMDTSGSMDTMKKYLARSFFFLLYQFVRTKYRTVDLVFIAHHSQAREVSEEEFFHKGESGGTMISSGYRKALDIIDERYHPSLWNVYAFHCSDGDNFDSDQQAAMKAAQELCEMCNLFGYGEIKPLGVRYAESTMLDQFESLGKENFQAVLIERKEDIWPSFKSLLSKDRGAS
ncbi:MAG: YeaH/YhbH family protein [Alphaproteobacteria bacterium]